MRDKAAAEADRASAEAEDYASRKDDGRACSPRLRAIQIPEEGDGELDDVIRCVCSVDRLTRHGKLDDSGYTACLFSVVMHACTSFVGFGGCGTGCVVS